MKTERDVRRNPAAMLALGLIFSLAWPAGAVRAASPPFAYTEEKWASLRDDKLEFDEIADLVHEYNSTVIQNEIDYKDYQGKDRDEIAQTYYDTADEIYGSLDYPDSDDENYGSRLASAQSSELQADQMMEKGDENVSDGDVIRWGYDKTEKTLVQSAQNLMLTYWSTVVQLDTLKNTKEQALASYEAAVNKAAAGTGTQSAVLSAQETVLNADASIISVASTLAETKESLCLMLGWDYGAQVEIGTLPAADPGAVALINLEEDLKKASGNNYDLRILRREVNNAMVGTLKQEKEEALKSGEQAVAANVKAAYQSLLLARNQYEQALQSLALEETAKAAADRKIAAGTISQTAYQNQCRAYRTAAASCETAAMSLLKAQLSYDWAVSGLAKSS